MNIQITITNVPDEAYKQFYADVRERLIKEVELPAYSNRDINIDFNNLVKLSLTEIFRDIITHALAGEATILSCKNDGDI